MCGTTAQCMGAVCGADCEDFVDIPVAATNFEFQCNPSPLCRLLSVIRACAERHRQGLIHELTPGFQNTGLQCFRSEVGVACPVG